MVIEPDAASRPAGYSGTPLPKKLGIKPGHRVRFVAAPPEFFAALGELPPEVQVMADAEEDSDLDAVVYFTTSADELRARYRSLADSIGPAGMLWGGVPILPKDRRTG